MDMEELVKSNENALFELFKGDESACKKKEEFEAAFDKVIKKEILPFLSREYIDRLYNFFLSLYRVVSDRCGTAVRNDIADINNWYGNKAEHLSEYEYDMIITKIAEINSIAELEEYKKYLERKVFPVADTEQIKGILDEIDGKYKVLKLVEEQKKKWKEEEKIISKFRIGMRVELNGLKGEVIDVSTSKVRVKFDIGYTSWIEPEKLEIIS